jgi:hypothetical protein
MAADLTIANAIIVAAARVSNGKDQDAIIAWLEQLRALQPQLFNEVITKLKKDPTP